MFGQRFVLLGRKDLAHLNEVYVAPDMEGVSLQQRYDDIEIL
jgi:hypothetical protein